MKKRIRLTESELTKIINKIIKEIKETNPYDELKSFLESRIDFEGYGGIRKNENKFTKLYEIFVDEYGWAIEKYGVKKAIIEWLRGLPSSIDIPYYHHDILNLLYALGFDEVKNMEDDKMEEFYYSIVVDTILENK